MYENIVDDICSLCVVVELGYEAKLRLLRIADVKKDKVEPFILESGRDSYSNKQTVFNPRLPEVGSVGFWDWHYEYDGRQKSYFNKRYRWIECITFENSITAKEAIEQLQKGIEAITIDHDYLFIYENYGDVSLCFFVSGTDLQVNSDKAVIKESVDYLNVYQVSRNDIYDINSEYLPGFQKQFYGQIAMGESHKRVYVKNINRVIKEHIYARINSYVPSRNRSEKAIVKNFLAALSDSPLVKNVAEQLDCSEDDAEIYVDDFLSNCKGYFKCEDDGAKALKRLIVYDTALAKQFEKQVKAAWEEENHKQIEGVNADLSKRKSNVDAVQQEYSTLVQKRSDLIKKKSHIEKEIECLGNQQKKIMAQANGIESGIRKKLELAGQDISDFFAQYAMFAPNVQLRADVSTNNENIMPSKYSDDPELICDIEELCDAFQDNLEAVGINKDKSKPLAAYLLAAYFNRHPLIIAGYGGDLILNALSVTMVNRTAMQVYNMNEIARGQMEEIRSGDVVAVYGNFDMGRLNRVIRHSTSPFVAVIASTVDELSIEPKGIYDYALPLFAQYYFTSFKTQKMQGYENQAEFDLKGTTKRFKLSYGALSQFAKRQAKLLAADTARLHPDAAEFDFLCLQAIPVMLLTKGRDETADYIDHADLLLDSEKKALMDLIGEADE